MTPDAGSVDIPAAAHAIFGERIALAARFVDMLRTHGVERGLIGPREADRLWDRHVLNSAVVAELLSKTTTVIDVGSGAGFPGIPLAIARPDLTVTLLEPMARRTEWLREVLETLELGRVTVVRGRAEEKAVREELDPAAVATARAVAPLAKLAGWCLPLVRPGGRVLALKGASAADEVSRDRGAVQRAGGTDIEIVQCGDDALEVPTTVVSMTRTSGRPRTGRRR